MQFRYTTTTATIIIIIEQVLYDLENDHMKKSCSSKANDASCLSHFASKIAGGFCEYCCITEWCNDDWAITDVRDDCTEQSAAAAVQCWPFVAGVLIIAVHAMFHC